MSKAQKALNQRRLYQRWYSKTPQGKSRYHRYAISPKGKARHKKYNRSLKGKKRERIYRHTEKGRAVIAKMNRSPKGRLRRKRYLSKPAVKEHQKWLNLSCKRSRRLRASRI